MTSTDNKDIFGFADIFKQFADSLNEGAEQIKRATKCKMRRFYRVAKQGNEEDALGVVFPDGTVVLQEYVTGNLSIYDSTARIKTTTHYFQWIDPEKP